MQSPPLHHPVPQHRVSVEATNQALNQPMYGNPYENAYPAQASTAASAAAPMGASTVAPMGASVGAGNPASTYYAQPGYASGQPPPPLAFNPLDFVNNSQLGQHALNYGQQYLTQSFDSYGVNAGFVRYYFQVSTLYVRRKLALILFPWRHRPWNRRLAPAQGAGGQEQYATPSEDLNAPDMYIPLMAFITHLIMIALSQGVEGNFHPEQFGARASKALALVLGELMLLKVATYLLSASSSSLFDLFAYSGYKFVALTLTALAGLVLKQSAVKWSVFAYTGAATAFFMLRSLKYILLPEYSPTNAATATTTISGSKRQQRIQFLFFYGVICQLALMWLLL